MRKYIKSERSNLVYTIERQNYTETFRTPENYFKHATRAAWFSVDAGFNVFVYYQGVFYMVARVDGHGTITTLSFTEVTAEEATAATADYVAELMNQAQDYERAAIDAAIEYDAESASKNAKEAEFNATAAEAYARKAAEYAAEAGTPEAAGAADDAGEFAAIARRDADHATETAEQATAEAEQAEATEHDMPDDETAAAEAEAAKAIDEATKCVNAIENADPANVKEHYKAADRHAFNAQRHAQRAHDYRADEAERAAFFAASEADIELQQMAYEAAEALADAANATNAERRAARAVAYSEIAGAGWMATDEDRDTVAAMVEAIAASATAPKPYTPEEIRAKFDSPFFIWDDEPEPAHAYQRAELEAFLGSYVNDYDVDAIEAEATEHDPKTGRTVWTPEAVNDLLSICERHECRA